MSQYLPAAQCASIVHATQLLFTHCGLVPGPVQSLLSSQNSRHDSDVDVEVSNDATRHDEENDKHYEEERRLGFLTCPEKR